MKELPIVFSAARLIDMAMWYPQLLIDRFHDAATRHTCHTLMIWTKYPESVLREPLHSFLLDLRRQGVQVCLQQTITGMGGSIIEPGVPAWQEAVVQLPEVIDLIDDPRRIKLRIDPQLRYIDETGVSHDNYELFEPIMAACAQLGIEDFTTSFVENKHHKKVTSRFVKKGWTLDAPGLEERIQIAQRMKAVAAKYGVSIAACAVPGLPISHCLDPVRLEELHPTGLKLVHEKKKKLGRELCGCCKDVDLGVWPPLICYGGCTYCYGNPVQQ